MEPRMVTALGALLLHGAAIAQCTIEGSVVGPHDASVEGANLVCDAPPLQAITDARGRFTVQVAEAGEMHLRITHLAFEPLDTVLHIGAGRHAVVLRMRPNTVLMQEVEVSAVRAGGRAPIARSMLTQEEIARTNIGLDMPYLLERLPSVVATSDGGTGIGYTGLRIRGSDPTRVNVTINGVPLNDAESATVYWVDLPDFASSTQDVQVQRGAGSSTNGPGAFGASINLRTASLQRKPFARLDLSGGSYDTRRASVQGGSGLLNDRFALEARLSTVKSDGYIDRATADLKSYFLQGAWVGRKRSVRFITFGGKEVTYQAWAGVPREVIDTNRTYNPYTYENEVDDYAQTHHQLLFDQDLGGRSTLNLTLFRVDGAGYYENFIANVPTWEDVYLPYPIYLGDDTVRRNDYVIRRWLDNTLLGASASAKVPMAAHELVIGGSYSNYRGDHFGEVIWARIFGQYEKDHRYYENDGHKTDANAFAKLTYALNGRVDLYGDLQWRAVRYDFLGYDADLVNVTQTVNYVFFNPKAGVMMDMGAGVKAHASVSVANKEPNRDDLVESTPKSRPRAEGMFDYEAGAEWRRSEAFAGMNLFYMDYTDQLVLTGEINDVGAYGRVNVPKSYRAGVEAEMGLRPFDRLSVTANVTLSRNRIQDLVEYVDDWDNGGQLAVHHKEVDIAFSPSVIAGGEVGYRLCEDQRVGAVDLAFIGKYVGGQYLDDSGSDDRALDPYLVADLRLNWAIAALPGTKEVTFNCTVRNVFNARYESNGWAYSYMLEGRRQAMVGLFPQAPRNVMAGLTLRF